MSTSGTSSLVFKPHIEALISEATSNLFPQIQIVELEGRIASEFFGRSKETYLSYIRNTIGSIQIFKIKTAINLEEIYIESKLFSEEEAYFSYSFKGIRNLRYGRRVYRNNESTSITADALKNTGSLMVLGDPGAGKSTLLRAIALSSISDDECLNKLDFGLFPIYVELRKYAEILGEKSEISILEYFFAEYGHENFRQVIAYFADNRKCIFLLDALDEVPQRHQTRVIREIQKLKTDFPETKIIVSSRIGHRNRLRGFNIHELADFSEHERNQFITKWMKVSQKPDKAEKLIREIARQSGIAEITSNPLMLSLLCILYLREVTLPERRSAVYKKCINALINEWDAEREFERTSSYSKVDDDIKLRMLSEMAVHYSRHSERYFSKDDVISLARGILEKFEVKIGANEFVKEIFSHHGIIVEVGHELYGFSHLTFQEYLTARYFIDENEYSEMIRNYSSNSSWSEIVKLTASDTPKADVLIDEITRAKNLTSFDKLELISYCLASHTVIPVAIRKNLVDIVKRLTIDVFKEQPYSLIRGTERARIDKETEEIGEGKLPKTIFNLTKMLAVKPKDDANASAMTIFRLLICRDREWFRTSVSPQEVQSLRKYEAEIVTMLFGSEPISVIDAYLDENVTYIYRNKSGPSATSYRFIERNRD